MEAEESKPESNDAKFFGRAHCVAPYRVKCDMQNEKRRTERKTVARMGRGDGNELAKGGGRRNEEGLSRSRMARKRGAGARPRKRQTDGFTYL